MTPLTLELLENRLPISNWNKTEHILASVTKTAVQIHYLEHSPIWGFQRNDTCSSTHEWQAQLDATVAGFTIPNAAEEFLAKGKIVEDSRKARARDLEAFLASALHGPKPPAPHTTLLALGETTAPRWYEMLASALGIAPERILAADEVSFPSAPDLDSLLKAQVFVFPWEVSVAVAQPRRGDLVADSKGLLPRDSVPRAGIFRGSASLYLAPLATSIELYLTRSVNGQTEAFDALEVHPTTEPFDLNIRFVPRSETPDCFVKGIPANKLAKSSPPIPGALVAKSTEEGKSTDLAFLIDGSMSRAEFDRARSFVRGITDALTRSTPPLRLACVLYAEYQERKGYPGRVPWKYDVLMQNFASQANFEQYLENACEAGVIDDDPCDALELGLQCLRKLSWQSQTRIAVLVGNSPPHPTSSQRAEKSLLDRETEQYQGIKWDKELRLLVTTSAPSLVSVWVPPDSGSQTRDRYWQNYADEVWQTIGRQLCVKKTETTDQQELIDLIRSIRGAGFDLDHTVALPVGQALPRSFKL